MIVLTARNEAVLQAAYARAQDIGLPCCLFTDDDRAADGAISLGIGPLINGDGKEITKKFSCM